MESYVIDTNILFNMEARLGLGKTSRAIIENLTQALQQRKTMIFIPPSIQDEIISFFDTKKDETVLTRFFGSLTIQSPAVGTLSIPATVVCDLIEDYRSRAYRGMKVAEEEIIKTAEQFMGKEVLPRNEFQISAGKIISTLRERYRTATRTGTLDSTADSDIILLAQELEAPLVTTDAGVLTWARKIGVKEMSPHVFGKKMQEYL